MTRRMLPISLTCQWWSPTLCNFYRDNFTEASI